MRVAINLLSEDPDNPSGAHWFWTRVIPGMAQRLGPGKQVVTLAVDSGLKYLHTDVYKSVSGKR